MFSKGSRTHQKLNSPYLYKVDCKWFLFSTGGIHNGNKLQDTLVLIFFTVYIVAYGVAVQSLVYPDTWDPEFSLPWGILFRPFFEMLGDPNFEDIGATHFDNCTNGADAEWPYKMCAETRKTIYALSLKAIFMLFTNVLLLNLLIAIFNNRYTTVDQQSKLYLKYQSFVVTQEYARRLVKWVELSLQNCFLKKKNEMFGFETSTYFFGS